MESAEGCMLALTADVLTPVHACVTPLNVILEMRHLSSTTTRDTVAAAIRQSRVNALFGQKALRTIPQYKEVLKSYSLPGAQGQHFSTHVTAARS